MAIIGIIAAIAVPVCFAPACRVMRRRRSARCEPSTADRRLALELYAARMQLLSRTSCWPSSGGQGFISPDLNLTHVIKSGYYVDLEDDGGQAFTGTVCNASTPESVPRRLNR